MLPSRTARVAQWIGACLPMQGTRVWPLAWEDCTCHRTAHLLSPGSLLLRPAPMTEEPLLAATKQALGSSEGPMQSKASCEWETRHSDTRLSGSSVTQHHLPCPSTKHQKALLVSDACPLRCLRHSSTYFLKNLHAAKLIYHTPKCKIFTIYTIFILKDKEAHE